MHIKTMLFACVVGVFGAATPVCSLAPRQWGNCPSTAGCLSNSVATQVVNQFGSLISNYSASVATNLLDPQSFVDTSDSINFLAGIPLGSPTFSSAAAFEAGQGTQPKIPFTVLAVDAVTCSGVIAFRWTASVGFVPGQAAKPVKGIDILYLKNHGDANKIGPKGWQITQVFSEFNSAVWDQGVGGTCNPPSHA